MLVDISYTKRAPQTVHVTYCNTSISASEDGAYKHFMFVISASAAGTKKYPGGKIGDENERDEGSESEVCPGVHTFDLKTVA